MMRGPPSKSRSGSAAIEKDSPAIEQRSWRATSVKSAHRTPSATRLRTERPVAILCRVVATWKAAMRPTMKKTAKSGMKAGNLTAPPGGEDSFERALAAWRAEPPPDGSIPWELKEAAAYRARDLRTEALRRVLHALARRAGRIFYG
jgi:hypothetical protein